MPGKQNVFLSKKSVRDGGAFLFKVNLSQSKFGYFRIGKRQIKGEMNGFRKLGEWIQKVGKKEREMGGVGRENHTLHGQAGSN